MRERYSGALAAAVLVTALMGSPARAAAAELVFYSSVPRNL